MAFTRNVLEPVHIVTAATSDHLTPTQPGTPVVTVSVNGGVSFVAATGTVTTTAYGVAYTIMAAESEAAGAAGYKFVAVRVTSANCDPVVREFYFEDAYTAARAPKLDNADAAISAVKAKTDNLPASPAAVGSNMGTVTSVTGNVGGNVTGSVGSVASFGTLVADIAAAVWASTTRTLTAFGFTVTAGTVTDKIVPPNVAVVKLRKPGMATCAASIVVVAHVSPTWSTRKRCVSFSSLLCAARILEPIVASVYRELPEMSRPR